MTPLTRLRSFLTALLRRRHLETDMADEWQFHVDARVETLVAEGLSREDAERRARREFGDPVRWREEAREARGLGWLQDLAADLRYAARSLAQARAFTLTAVMTLTLGVGLNTGVFSIANGLLFRPWPLPEAHRIGIVFKEAGPGRWWSGASPTEYRFLRDESTGMDLVAISESVGTLNLGRDGESIPARIVSGNYFSALRMPMALGRGLHPDDDDLSAPSAVAVIGHGLWRDRFGGAANVLGQTIQLNDVPFEIVGVAARGATDTPTMRRTPAVWVPLATYPQIMPDLEFHRGFLTNPDYCCVTLVGRLRESMSRTAAAASLELALARLYPDSEPRRVQVTGTAVIDQPWDNQAVVPLSLVIGAVLLVLLVACANLGNLQLARTLARRRELAVRAALGASRARIVRQLLTEGLLVAAVAGVTALVAAHAIVRALARLMPSGPVDDLAALVAPDLRVFGFGLLAAMTAMLAAGLGPALAGTRHLVVTGPASHERRVRLRAAFLAVQVGLSVVLLVGAALLARGVARASTLVPDSVEHVVRVQVSTPSSGSGRSLSFAGSEPATASAASNIVDVRGRAAGWRLLLADLRERLGPGGADRVAVIDGTVWMPVRSAVDGVDRWVWGRTVSPELFSLLDIPVLAGDLFLDTSDPADVVVNESLARMLWPGQAVLGRTLHDRDGPAWQERRVIAVVSDAHWFDRFEPGPTVFERGFGRLLVPNEPAILDAVRSSVAEISPGADVSFLPVEPGSLTGYIAASRLAAALGLIALGMATAGTFGVLMYLFTQRTREIAVRMALGARTAHVARLITSEALGALAIGAAAGLALSAAAAPVLREYLLGLPPYDPMAYIAAAGVLALAIVLASVTPIRRAASIDPAITLRHE